MSENLSSVKCNFYFGSKYQLKKHLATGHEIKNSNFECSKCNVGFEQESDLKLHINIAHDKNEIVFVLEQKKPFACKGKYMSPKMLQAHPVAVLTFSTGLFFFALAALH